MIRSLKQFAFGTIFAAALAGAACAAQAETSRLYMAGYLGLTTLSNEAFSETTVPARGDIKFDNAGTFAGALGLRLNNKWRIEAEASYHKNDMSDIDIRGAGTFPIDGSVKTWLWMLNAYYDFDLEWDYIRPFVTAGIGLAYHDGQINDSSGFATDASDDSLGMAWQVGGGLKYKISDSLSLTGGYRWLGGSDAEIDGYEIDISGHEFRMGLEYDLPMGWLD